jgi:hypothetical protein
MKYTAETPLVTTKGYKVPMSRNPEFFSARNWRHNSFNGRNKVMIDGAVFAEKSDLLK